MSFIRLSLAAPLLLALAACGGGSGLGGVLGGLNPGPGSIQCATGTQVESASPLPGQTVSGSIGQVIVVANGDNNNLSSTYGQWNLILTDQYGDPPIQGSNLAAVSDRSGPHPFGQDFYYASNIPQLPSGTTWNVSLNEQNGTYCSPVPLNSFNT